MVVIRGGRAEVSDYAAPGASDSSARRSRDWRQRSARATCRGCCSVEGRVNGRGGTAAVQGYYRDDTKAWLGRLSARGLDAAHWLGYFSRPGVSCGGGGRAEVQFLATADGPKRQPEGEGKIRLRQATLRVPGLARPLTEAEIEPGRARYLATAGADDWRAPVRFWGDSLPGLTPDFRLRLGGSARRAAAGPRSFSDCQPASHHCRRGAGRDRGEVAGHGAAVAVTGKARVAALAYEGVRLFEQRRSGGRWGKWLR